MSWPMAIAWGAGDGVLGSYRGDGLPEVVGDGEEAEQKRFAEESKWRTRQAHRRRLGLERASGNLGEACRN
jgi:hypothetical protein